MRMTQTMSVKVESKKNCEHIHSGQFMVSHFEQEEEAEDEYQDYPVDDDDECDDISESSNSKVLPGPSTNVCTQLERYRPQAQEKHYEIDSDLSQVFNTLNVTYKQKLTSPKWNPFKGIKLRWKEKIRLNNVIWRCWHMQFILKKRPSVCQFASPLDVDIHNTPQAIILEGKYWKRKWKVITAEYKKWRRYNVSKAFGAISCLDTKSELDILEWSNDNLLMLSDNMSSDTLFSTISQFPFPDSREIARAGRADFIQPSLGPLQPNFDDLMDLDIDILNTYLNNRLAPVQEVPESEELLKDIEFPMITSIDTSTMQDIISSHPTAQQHSVIQSNTMNLDQQQDSTSNQLLFTATIFTQDMSQSNNTQQHVLSLQNNQIHDRESIRMMTDLNPFMGGTGIDISRAQQAQSNEQQMMAPPSDHDDKDSYKGKFSRVLQWKSQLPSILNNSKREPHNYDKCQPTPHQTTLYTQMLAQQQETPQPAQMYNTSPYTDLNDVTNINHMSPIQTTTNNFNTTMTSNNQQLSNAQNALNLSNNQMYQNKMYQQQQANLQNQIGIDQQQTHDNSSSYKSPQSPSFRSYHHSNQQPYKIPSQNSGYNATNRIMMRQQSPPLHSSSIGKSLSFQQQQNQQHQQNATAAAMKEMYRSNSLPINANIQLPKEMMNSGDFAVPKYPTNTASTVVSTKIKNARARSNSINLRHNQLIMTPLQSANSEPTLNVNNVNTNSALAQLLTNTSTSLIGQKAHSISSSAMSMQQQQSHVQPQRANSFTSSSLVQNSILMAVNAATASNKSIQQQPATSTTSNLYQTPTLSPESTYQESNSSYQHDLPQSLSPERCIGMSKYQSRDNRRAGHIHAEQKRRYNIKNGFDMLHSLIPQLQQNPNAKLSKAAMLQKGAEYIKQLRSERTLVSEEMDRLKKEIETLTNSLK
ncbi:hypothetical protein ACKWTF_005617 [Chironomus riparius]